MLKNYIDIFDNDFFSNVEQLFSVVHLTTNGHRGMLYCEEKNYTKKNRLFCCILFYN